VVKDLPANRAYPDYFLSKEVDLLIHCAILQGGGDKMNISEWLIAISSLATIALAIAAFLSIRQNRKMLAEEKQSEFKRRTLNEIISWVIQVNNSCIPPSGTGKEAWMDWSRNIVTSLISEGKWASRNSNIFGSEFNNNINKLHRNISNFNALLATIWESSDTSTKQAKQQILSEPLANILKATDNVLDRALKIRSDEKL